MVQSGGSTDVHDVPDVEALRVAVMRLRADPRVDSYKWRRLRDVELHIHCPHCNGLYDRPNVRERYCRCGLMHVHYRCPECFRQGVEPAEHDGCGDIPPDHERWRTKGWTMWHWPI